MNARFFSLIARHWATCRRFQGPAAAFLYAYGRLLRRLSGPMPGRHAVVGIRLHGQPSPFHVRLASTDWLVLEEIFHHGEYALVQDQIRDARWVVDLGANAGFSVRYWHTLFPAVRVIAVEPEPGNCQSCARNICAAGLTEQVTLVQAAVGARRGRAELVDTGGEWAYQFRAETIGRGTSVKIRPLEEILDWHAPGRTIDLLKCDIEGAERELFAHCEKWIERVNAIVIELHPPYELPALQNDLARAGAAFFVAEVASKQSCPVVLLRRVTPAPPAVLKLPGRNRTKLAANSRGGA